MLWTRENVAELATRRQRDLDRESEFETKRRQRMQEREHRARLCRVESGNVIAFPSRAPVDFPDDAA
jgi:hypothetical protein